VVGLTDPQATLARHWWTSTARYWRPAITAWTAKAWSPCPGTFWVSDEYGPLIVHSMPTVKSWNVFRRSMEPCPRSSRCAAQIR